MMSTQETIVEQRSPSASPLPAAHSPSEEAAVDTLSMEDFPPPPPSLLPVAEKEGTTVEATATSSVSVSALRHWASPRTVLLERQPNRSLGISIVGGKVQMSNGTGTETTITGIFIKQVLPDSPAGREGKVTKVAVRQTNSATCFSQVALIFVPFPTDNVRHLDKQTKLEWFVFPSGAWRQVKNMKVCATW